MTAVRALARAASAARWPDRTACCSGFSDGSGAGLAGPDAPPFPPAAVSWLLRSLSTWRSAWARVDCAEVRLAVRSVVSRAPRACPAVTCWPGVTFTAATVPLTVKATSAWCTGVTVPVAARAAVTLAEATVARR